MLVDIKSAVPETEFSAQDFPRYNTQRSLPGHCIKPITDDLSLNFERLLRSRICFHLVVQLKRKIEEGPSRASCTLRASRQISKRKQRFNALSLDTAFKVI